MRRTPIKAVSDQAALNRVCWHGGALALLAMLVGALTIADAAASDQRPPTAASSGATPNGVDFTLQNLKGQSVSLSDYRGQWVVVNFWATWCGPCVHEIPELQRFHDERKDHDAVVLGVLFEPEIPNGLDAFLKNTGLNYPVVKVEDYPLIPFEPLKGLPSTFFVNPAGELVGKVTGPVTKAAIEGFIAIEDQGCG